MNERKRTRQRLDPRVTALRVRRAEDLARRHELLLATAGCLGWEWEVETGSVYLEGDAFAFAGLPSPESVATIQEFLGLVHPEDRQMHQESLKRALVRGRGPYTSPFRLIRRDDGRAVFVEDRGLVGWGEDYSSLRVTGYLFELK